jgi:protein subunit release factor A
MAENELEELKGNLEEYKEQLQQVSLPKTKSQSRLVSISAESSNHSGV